MKDPRYLWAVFAAWWSAADASRGRSLRTGHRLRRCGGHGVYGVYGVNKALVAGLAPEAALLVGVCNAVGGGLIRDVLVREEPVLLKPGQLYALASLAGCICFVLLSYKYGVDVEHAAWISIFVTLLFRVLAIRFNWTTTAFGKWRWLRHDKSNKHDN